LRIAISGTHCCGKSTLIDEFLCAHPDFVHEPEPYEALQEEYGEMFADEPCAEDFYRQLEYNVGRLRQYASGDRVIYERSPADFVAYMLALIELGRDRDASRVLQNSLRLARDAVSLLDAVVFLPTDDSHSEAPESEDPELRGAVDTRLESILIDDDLGWFGSRRPIILKASGTTAQRLLTIERFMQLQFVEREHLAKSKPPFAI
jgi:hypothetical protein